MHIQESLPVCRWVAVGWFSLTPWVCTVVFWVQTDCDTALETQDWACNTKQATWVLNEGRVVFSYTYPVCFCRVSSLSLCSTHLFNSFMRVNNLPLYIPPIYSPLWHHHTRYESMYPQPHSLSDMRVCSLPVSLPSTNLVASTMRVCSLPLCAPTHHYKSIYRPSRQSHHWIVSDCGLQPPSDKDFCKNIIIITHNSHQIIWSNTVYS